MLRLTFSLISIFIWANSSAQIKSDAYIATYSADIKLDAKPKSPPAAILEFNAEEALYYYPGFPKEISYSSAGNTHSISFGDSDQNSVYTSLTDSVVIWKTNYGGTQEGNFWAILTDSIPKIKWTITDSIRQNQFDSYSLYAYCSYQGREYTVWYIPSFPTSFGPYKFHGLPGLIEEIRSTDGKINLKLTSITITEPKKLTPPKNGIYYTKEEHRDAVIRKLLSSEANALKNGVIGTNYDPPSGYEIEKDIWNYNAEYKKKRSRRN